MNAVAPQTDGPDLVNYDAEQAYLGACLANNEAWHRAADRLRPEHFADALHARIYEAIGRLASQGVRADPVTLKRQFDKDGALAEIGGAAYLVELARNVVSILDAEDYAEAIIDLARRRVLRDALLQGLAEITRVEAGETADTIMDRIDAGLAGASGGDAAAGTMQSAAEAVRAAEIDAEAAFKRGGVGGIATGLIDLDEAISGLHAPDMIVLAGRPGMGKTALADSIALGAAKAGARTGFFTLEMSNVQQGQRIIAAEAGITVERLRSGQLGAGDFEVLRQARDTLANLPLWFDDDPAVTVDTIMRRARRLQRRHGLDLVIVDYLQLARSAKGDRRAKLYEEVTDLSRGMKAMAKTLGVPVLVLSQLSRDVEKRDDKRPVLSDLRESGAIEQDADSVWFAYREEYYLEKSEPRRRDGEDDDAFYRRLNAWQRRLMNCRNVAEIIIAKNRHGPVRTVKLRFNGARQRFENLSEQQG